MSPGYGVVIRPEPRQLAGWQIRMSVPFMLSIDYLHINAHPYLPPTRLGLRVSGYACACYALTGRSGFGYYFFTLPQGFRLRPAGYAETGTPWAIELTAPPVGGAQNSARLRLAKFQFVEQIGASSKMALMFLLLTKSLGHVWVDCVCIQDTA